MRDRFSLLVCITAICVLIVCRSPEARAEASTAENDRRVKETLDTFRAEVQKMPGIEPGVVEKYLRAVDRLFKRSATVTSAVQAAASRFDESDALNFASLKGNRSKLAALKGWQEITEAYEVEATAGKQLFGDLAGSFKKELEREKLSEKQIAALLAGFVKAEKMDKVKEVYELQAKMAGSANRFVKLLIESEALWSVDLQSEEVESDDEQFIGKYNDALTAVQHDMEGFNALIDSVK